MNIINILRICHACVLIQFDKITILTDPWFNETWNNKRGEKLGLTIEELPKIDVIVISHGHKSHYDLDALAAYPDKSVCFIVKKGLGAAARKIGFTNVIELDHKEIYSIKNITISALHAQQLWEENTYLIQSQDKTIFFGADSLLTKQMIEELAGIKEKIDLMLLSINGLVIRPLLYKRVSMNSQEAIKLCEIFNPHYVVPIHYTYSAGFLCDTFLIKKTSTINDFESLLQNSSTTTKLVKLTPGQQKSITLRGKK